MTRAHSCGKRGKRDQPFPVVPAGPDKRAVGAGCGEVAPHGSRGKRQVHQQVQEQSRINGDHQGPPLGARTHRQEQESGHQQERRQFQRSHPGGEDGAYFSVAVRALRNGGKKSPVQEHQENAAVPGALAHRAFLIRRKAQPCSGMGLVGGVLHGGLGMEPFVTGIGGFVNKARFRSGTGIVFQQNGHSCCPHCDKVVAIGFLPRAASSASRCLKGRGKMAVPQ